MDRRNFEILIAGAIASAVGLPLTARKEATEVLMNGSSIVKVDDQSRVA